MSARGLGARWLIGVLGCVALFGCSRSLLAPATEIQTDAFVAPGATSVRWVASGPAEVEAASPAPLPVIGDPALDVRAEPGAPGGSNEPAAPAESPMFVDAKVGDVNGRPIYANAFLSSIEDRLSAEARRRAPANWQRFAAGLIRDELNRLIEDELLRAEALASFTPQQRQGLRFFIKSLRERARRGSLGSASLAEQRIQESEGVSLDEWIKDQQARALVRHQVEEQIISKVRVTWRDVQRYYELNSDRFNPDPIAHFRRIRLREPSPEQIDRVSGALESGTPFEQVARWDLNVWRPEEGGAVDPVSFKGEFSHAAFAIGPEVLNEAAPSLEVGHWAGPLRYEVSGVASADWIYLDSIERRNRPLEDPAVQIEIEQTLRNGLLEMERRRYLRRLMDRATFTDIDQMTRQLLRIATERYLPARPGPRG